MGINFMGELVDKPRIKAGYIGCGSHSRRNVLPALKFASDSVETVAICDLKYEKAQTFASEFGFKRAYGNHIEMLEKEDLDVVFIVTGYDGSLRLCCVLDSVNKVHSIKMRIGNISTEILPFIEKILIYALEYISACLKKDRNSAICTK